MATTYQAYQIINTNLNTRVAIDLYITYEQNDCFRGCKVRYSNSDPFYFSVDYTPFDDNLFASLRLYNVRHYLKQELFAMSCEDGVFPNAQNAQELLICCMKYPMNSGICKLG